MVASKTAATIAATVTLRTMTPPRGGSPAKICLYNGLPCTAPPLMQDLAMTHAAAEANDPATSTNDPKQAITHQPPPSAAASQVRKFHAGRSHCRPRSPGSTGHPRVLLLARGTGEWWPQLAASTDASVRSLVKSAARVALAALPTVPCEASDVVRAAVSAFAAALSVALPEQVVLPVPAEPVPILGRTAGGAAHAAALRRPRPPLR